MQETCHQTQWPTFGQLFLEPITHTLWLIAQALRMLLGHRAVLEGQHKNYYASCYKCIAPFSIEFDPHPPPHYANKFEPYTFVTIFLGKLTPPPAMALRNTWKQQQWLQLKSIHNITKISPHHNRRTQKLLYSTIFDTPCMNSSCHA